MPRKPQYPLLVRTLAKIGYNSHISCCPTINAQWDDSRTCGDGCEDHGMGPADSGPRPHLRVVSVGVFGRGGILPQLRAVVVRNHGFWDSGGILPQLRAAIVPGGIPGVPRVESRTCEESWTGVYTCRGWSSLAPASNRMPASICSCWPRVHARSCGPAAMVAFIRVVLGALPHLRCKRVLVTVPALSIRNIPAPAGRVATASARTTCWVHLRTCGDLPGCCWPAPPESEHARTCGPWDDTPTNAHTDVEYARTCEAVRFADLLVHTDRGARPHLRMVTSLRKVAADGIGGIPQLREHAAHRPRHHGRTPAAAGHAAVEHHGRYARRNTPAPAGRGPSRCCRRHWGSSCSHRAPQPRQSIVVKSPLG